MRDTGEYLGSLISRQSVTVVPQVAGYVRKIHVRPGQQVEAGAPLLEVDARAGDRRARERRRPSAPPPRSNLELAQQTRARTEALYKEGLVSAQELERARAQAEAAEAASRAAAAQVSQRQVQLQYYAVRAPFAGTVGDVLVRVGDFVGATTPLTSVAQADVLEVSVAVPAERARTLQPEHAAGAARREGKVLLTSNVFFVAPQADPRTQLVEREGRLPQHRGPAPQRAGARAPRLRHARRPADPGARGGAPERPALRLRGAGEGRQDGGGAPPHHARRRWASSPTWWRAACSEGDAVAVSSLQALRDGAPR